jgi:addiction module RelE/StbE family toxin
VYAAQCFERAFKKLPAQVQTFVKNKLFALEEQPHLDEPLQGKFRFLRSLHLKLENTVYRVVYRVNEESREIDLYYVASRENFYAELRRLNLKKIA